MAVVTPVLKLVLPAFDQTPWDVDMNNDLRIIDGVIGQFFGVPNFYGIWVNSKAFTAGQIVLDTVDASMWRCVVSHTSAASPISFAQDRTTNPAYWTLQQASAASAAAAAANSAAAAASSAAAAANSASNIHGAMPITGGAFTGPVTAVADPTVPLAIATKQYVDGRVGGAGFLPLTGGTLTGPLNLISTTAGAATVAARKDYVDAGDASRLPIVGGTLTGRLILANLPPLGLNDATTKAYVDSKMPITGGTFSGGVDVQGLLRSLGGRLMSWMPAGGGSRPTITMFYGDYGAAVGWSTSNGANVIVSSMDGAGNPSGVAYSILSATNFNLFNNQMSWTTDVPTGQMDWGINNVWHLGLIPALGAPVSGGQLSFAYYTNSGGTVNPIWTMRQYDNFAFNGSGPVGGYGAYVNLSDERFKTNVTDLEPTTAELKALHPVEYDWITSGAHDFGFISQEVQAVCAEAVQEIGIQAPDGSGGIGDANPSLGIKDTVLIAMLVKGFQELEARVTALNG
jgi:hypothetical protein